MQSLHYSQRFPNDSKYIKLTVSDVSTFVLRSLTTLLGRLRLVCLHFGLSRLVNTIQLAFVSHAMYSYLIVNFDITLVVLKLYRSLGVGISS